MIESGSNSGRKLLLSSVCQPFGEKYGDGFGTSFEGSHQLMWAQGIFRSRGTTLQWGIDFIAENLEIPTTTLHYPTMGQFIAELKKGYDYVGIAFVAQTLHKMIPMTKAVREHAPNTKIVLGGYGTAIGVDALKDYGDHICQSEGVSYMRELLGERPDTPFVQPDITQQQSIFSLRLLNEVGYIFAGLGCPNGCDFCATSHYFKRKHIYMLPDGPSILQAMHRMREKHPGMDTFWLNDEDFLLNPKRGKGFLEAIRKSKLPPLSLSIFSSVKALSQYKASELVEMGIDWIWVGFEGKRAGYAKMRGRSYEDLFADLRNHGISMMTSMIIGFDYQTPEIIEEEFEELLALRPAMCQYLIYGPAHQTPLYDRMEKEGRLLPEVFANPAAQDGFTLGFKHPHIGPAEMSAIQRRLYREEFRRLGPGILRVAEDLLLGHKNLMDHPSERVRAKARRCGKEARSGLKIVPASKRYVSAEIGGWLDRLQQKIIDQTGPLTIKERVVQRLAPALLLRETLKLRLNIGQQPEFTRKTFRMPATDLAPLFVPFTYPARG